MAMTFVCSSKMDLLGSDATQLYNRMSGYNSLFLAPLLLLLCSFRSPPLLGILSFIFKLVLRIDVPFRWYLGPQILVFSLECSDRNCGCILGRRRNFWNGQCLTLGKAEKALQDKRCRYIFLHCCGCNFFPSNENLLQCAVFSWNCTKVPRGTPRMDSSARGKSTILPISKSY